MVSYYHYQRFRQGRYHSVFSDFLRNEHYGLESWFKHYVSWQNRWTIIVRYEDLKQDTHGQMKQLLAFIGKEVDDEIVQEAISRSHFEKVRTVEVNESKYVDEKAQFARSGRNKQWTDYFADEDLTYFKRLTNRYNFNLYQ